MRTAIILGILLVPQILLLWNATPLLIALKQDPQVAMLSGSYLKVISLGTPGYAIFEITRRWLQAQGLMLAPTLVVGITAPINIFLMWLLVWSKSKANIGFLGAPAATAITMDLMALLGLLYCYLRAPRIGWYGWSTACFRNLGENWKLGVAGYAMTASEWISWFVSDLVFAN